MSSTPIVVEKLSQEDAGQLIKSLSGTKRYEPLANFCEAFTEEVRDGSNLRRALPESRRLYYAVWLEGVRYLLVGITPNIISDPVSVGLSFARIDVESRRAATKCLRVFIEAELLPYCRWLKKLLIKARIVNCDSKKVSDKLAQNLPLGVHVVCLSDSSCVFDLSQNQRESN